MFKMNKVKTLSMHYCFSIYVRTIHLTNLMFTTSTCQDYLGIIVLGGTNGSFNKTSHELLQKCTLCGFSTFYHN